MYNLGQSLNGQAELVQEWNEFLFIFVNWVLMPQKSIGAETLFLHEIGSYTLYPEIVKLLL